MLVQGASADDGTIQWSTVADRGVAISLRNDRHTVMLPRGAATFDGQIRHVRQVDDTFAVLVDVPGGTAKFMREKIMPGQVPPPNAIVAVDAEGRERWRSYGYDAIMFDHDGTIVAKDEFWRWTLDVRTGAVVDCEQFR